MLRPRVQSPQFYAPRTVAPEAPEGGFRRTAEAALRQVNFVWNTLDVIDRSFDNYERQPGFDPVNFGRSRPTWQRYEDSLIEAISERQFLDIERRLLQDENDMALLEAQGWGGTIALLTAGILDPTVFVPLTAGARGAKGMAQAWGLAGAAATASELPLILNHEREASEHFTGIAAGTVLGGLLGSASVLLRPEQRAGLEAALAPAAPVTPVATVRRTPEGENIIRPATPPDEVATISALGSARTGEPIGDIVVYRRDTTDVGDFDIGKTLRDRLYTTASESATEGYGPVLSRLRARVEKPFVVNMSEGFERVRAPGAPRAPLQSPPAERVFDNEDLANVDLADLRAAGHDAIVLQNVTDVGKTSHQVVFLTTKNLELLKRSGVDTAEEVAETVSRTADDVVEEAARTDAPAGSRFFETSQGSRYEVFPDGTTVRNKAARNTPGHEGDSGIKPRTAQTIYLAENPAVLSVAGLSNVGEARVVLRDGKATLITRNEDGKWGASASARDIPFSEQPGEGLFPLELWDQVAGGDAPEGFARMHAGNRITKVEGEAAPAGGGSLSAAARDARFIPEGVTAPDGGRTAGRLAPLLSPTGFTELSSRLSPVVRGIQQGGANIPSLVLRDAMQRLSTSGLRMEGNALGIATAPGGTVEAAIGAYIGELGRFVDAQYNLYLRYLKDGAVPTVGTRAGAWVNTAIGRAPRGKMTFREFKEQVTYAANVKNAQVDPIAREAADELRRLYETFNQRMLEATDFRGAKALYKILDESEFETYSHRIFSPEEIVRDRAGFERLIAKHYEDLSTAYAEKRIRAFLRAERAAGEAEHYMTLSREAAEAEVHRLEETLRRLGRRKEDESDELIGADALEAEAQALEDALTDSRIYDEDLAEYIESARAELGDDSDDAIRARIAELREIAGSIYEKARPTATETKEEAAAARRLLRTIKRGFGFAESKLAAIHEKVDTNESANLRALERIIGLSRTFLKRMGKLDEKVLDKELAKLEAALEKENGLLEKGRLRLSKLALGDPVAFEVETNRQLTRHLREMRLEAKRAAVPLDRERARAILAADMENNLRKINAANEKRSRRNQRLITEAERYDPKRIEADIKAEREGLGRRADELEETLRERGATNINIRQGRFSFAEHSRDLAQQLADRIIGNYSRLGQMDFLTEMRGPMKHRMLNLPYEKLAPYLEKDSEVIAARYTQQMSSDIELFRAFGDVSAKGVLENIRVDVANIQSRLSEMTEWPNGEKITEGQRAKLLDQQRRAMQGYVEDFVGSVERIRGLRGLTDGKFSIGHRAGRQMLNWNVLSQMGTVTISSMNDASRAIQAYGMLHVLGSTFIPMLRGLQSLDQRAATKEVRRQLFRIGIGIETTLNLRTRAALDMLQPDPFTTRWERVMDTATGLMPHVALFGHWTDKMKIMTGEASMARMMEVLGKPEAGGRLTEGEVQWLASLGIDAPMAARIWGSLTLDEGGATRFPSPYGEILVPNSESWRDRGAARAFEAALYQESENLVVSPGLEKPLWMDASMPWRLIAQFRSFTMASNSKITVATSQALRRTPLALRGKDMAAVHAAEGFAASIALSAVSLYLWAFTSGDEQWNRVRNYSVEELLDQLLARSGYLGFFSEVQGVAAHFPLVQDYFTFAGSPIEGRRAEDVVDQIAGPSLGKLNGIINVLQGMDEPTQGTINQARKMMILQNHFALRRGFTFIEESINDFFNLPERRQ